MTETKPATRALKPADEVRSQLQKMEPQFAMALPPHISKEKFLRVAQTAIANTPALLKADRQSLFAACMKAAQDGLLPDGRESALVPFKDQVQYLPMLQGILKKIRNSGELSSIAAQVVHKNDVFEYYVDGDGEHIKHRPLMFGERGEPIGVYAIAKTKDGALYVEVMTMDQVNAVKRVSRSASSGPWAGPFESEMQKKTVIRRLAKRLPSSTDLDMTMKFDDEDYDFDNQPAAAETERPSTRRKSRVHSAIADQAQTAVEQDVTPEPEAVEAEPEREVKAPPPPPAFEAEGEQIPI